MCSVNIHLASAPLPAAAARLYKYVFSDYFEEVTANLRDLILDQITMVHQPSPPESAELDLKLQTLYGHQAIPTELLQLFNGGLREWRCIIAPEQSQAALVATCWQSLQRQLVWVEDKPTITRFWLFGACIFAMLRLCLLGVDIGRLLTMRAVKPRPRNQRRIASVVAFFRRADTPVSIRVAALCMRLCLIATSISAKKPRRRDEARSSGWS